MLPKVGSERPSRPEIEALLDLAVRAPSHHLTQPWRFYVVAGDERDRLAQAIAEEASERGIPADEAIAEGRKKVSRAPVIVVFTCLPSQEEGIEEAEELVSVAMAIQNFLIGAHASGMGAMLRTGGVAYHPSVRKNLGLVSNERVVGFVYVGYPAGERTLTERTSAGELTTWLGWDS